MINDPRRYMQIANGLREQIRDGGFKPGDPVPDIANIRRLGPQAYLMIKPLAPDTGGEIAEKVAGHVRALDDLGMLVRLD